jgi:hypothetical protein
MEHFFVFKDQKIHKPNSNMCPFRIFKTITTSITSINSPINNLAISLIEAVGEQEDYLNNQNLGKKVSLLQV